MDTTLGAVAGRRERRWTRAEYERATQLGLFGPEERLELLAGRIVEKVTTNPPHSVARGLVEAFLRAAFPQALVRGQEPLVLDETSVPEPDVAVVDGTLRDYTHSHPTSALLVAEVADSSLLYDRTVKASLYARACIPEYWILNLVDRLLEVHRQPGPMAEQPLGFSYRSITCYGESECLAPAAAPQSIVRVADLLP